MEAQEGGLGAGQEGHDRGHVPSQAAQGHVHEQVGASSGSLSVAKRKAPMIKRQKPRAAKRLSSPIVTMMRSPGIRLMMSPRLLSPSASRARSPSVPRARSPSTMSLALEETRSVLGHGSSGRTRRRKLKSDIWSDFEPIYVGMKLIEAQYIHCNKLFKATRDVGTSSCRRHLESCEERARLHQLVDQMNSSNLSPYATTRKDWKFNQEVSRQELMKLIVLHELPFGIVEYPRFKSFVTSLNPLFRLVSRTTIKGDCISAYEQQRLALREVLMASTYRMSLTTHMWTSNKKLGYLCIMSFYR